MSENICPRIIVVSSSAEMGGAEKVLWNILSYWVRQSKTGKCKVLLPGKGSFFEFLESRGVDCDTFPLSNKSRSLGDSPVRKENNLLRIFKLVVSLPDLVKPFLKLRRLIREQPFDLLFANGFKAQILATLAAPKRMPVIWFFQDYLGSRKIVSKILLKIINSDITLIADSVSVAEDVKKIFPKFNVDFWHNTVDTGQFLPGFVNPNFLDQAAGLPLPWDGLRIGLVATFAKWKGQEVFLKAAKIVTEKTKTPIRFYLIGGPIYQARESQWNLEELEKIRQSLGMEKDLGFTGFQSDVVSIYRGIDILVHCSTSPDPFGQVIIEGMACGKAVIIAAHGGASEIGIPGDTCLHHKPGDADSLSEAILNLVENPELRRDLGINAKKEVENNFSLHLVNRRWELLFQKMALKC